MVISYIEICIRLISALVLTGMIGLERYTHDRASGFRPHILVGLEMAIGFGYTLSATL